MELSGPGVDVFSTYPTGNNFTYLSGTSMVSSNLFHFVMEEYDNDNIVDLFLNKLDTSKHKSFSDLSDLKVSSHLLIKRKGDIIQFVPFNLRAWHAGQSCYNNRENFNDFSIGIELEGTSDSKFTREQYSSLNEVIMALKSLYTNIVNENILGHSDISPGRKKDPGNLFDWSKVK